MKALAITSKGIEEITAKEIKEIINAETKVKNSCVVFDTKNPLDLCELCYRSQSITRVISVFDSFKFKDDEDLFGKLKSALDKVKLEKP